MSVPTPAARPPRVLGAAAIGFASFNCIVGAGIFGLPALVADILGPAAVLGYLVCTVILALVALCLAEAGSRVSDAGGVYAYATAAFGPVLGGIVGTMTWITNAAGSATVANLWVDTLAAAWPPAQASLARAALMIALYALLAVINVRGARQGSRVSIAIAVAKLVPLVGITVIGLSAVQPANLRWTLTPSIGAVGQAAVLLFFAFSGVEAGLTTSGEVRNPARTIPRAVLIACALVAALYMGLQLVAQGVLGPALAKSSTPLVDLAGVLLGPWGARAMVGAIFLSTLGYLVADLLCSPRALYALAGRGQLPRPLAAVHSRYGTPFVAVCTHATLAAFLAVSGSFRALALFTSATVLVVYLVCCLAVPRLRALGIEQAGPAFHAPGGLFVPLAAAGLVGFLLASLPREVLLATLVPIAVAGIAYGAQARLRRPADRGA